MSAPDASASAGIPPVARGLEPAWVRNGSAQVQREYALGLEFERLLVQQLASSLGEDGGQDAAGEGEGDAATSVLKTMLPGALADGVTAGGGLGLAAELVRGMQGAGGASPAATGGTRPETSPTAATAPPRTGGTSA